MNVMLRFVSWFGISGKRRRNHDLNDTANTQQRRLKMSESENDKQQENRPIHLKEKKKLHTTSTERIAAIELIGMALNQLLCNKLYVARVCVLCFVYVYIWQRRCDGSSSHAIYGNSHIVWPILCERLL